MSKQPTPREEEQADSGKPASRTGGDEETGTNAVEHEPDPKAQPLPDGHHKYMPRSPFTTGNY